jgi:hypothetical protein
VLDRAVLKIPVRIDKSNDLEIGIIVLYNQYPEFLYRNIDIRQGLTASATLKLDKNDKDLRNLGGSISIRDPSRLEFFIDAEKNEIDNDKLNEAVYKAQYSGSIIDVRIYLTELAPEPDKYTLSLRNEGDAVRNVRRSIKTKQKAADPELVELVNARKEAEGILELIESEKVEITKEKGTPAMKLKTYVMKGENVLVVPRANGNLIVKVQKTNGFAQGFFNTIAGFTNAVTNGVETLSGDRVIIDAAANKKYSEFFKVVNNEIREMDFEEIKYEIEAASGEVDELNMSKGVGGASKRRRNKDNAKDGLKALLIEDGDGITICEGEITEVRESGNENNIVFVLRPLDGATVSKKKVNGATVNMIFGEVVDSVAAK